jgi:hypothetical protein
MQSQLAERQFQQGKQHRGSQPDASVFPGDEHGNDCISVDVIDRLNTTDADRFAFRIFRDEPECFRRVIELQSRFPAFSDVLPVHWQRQATIEKRDILKTGEPVMQGVQVFLVQWSKENFCLVCQI